MRPDIEVATGAATAVADTSASCRLVSGAADMAVHHEIRHEVFVLEQGVFAASDRDDRDDLPETLRVLGLCAGRVIGTVRLYPLDPADPHGDWQGDRLAVRPGFRSQRVGGPLTRYAVATAAARGGRRMIAHVQIANRVFFRRMGWNELGDPDLYLGLPHVLMDIDLTAVDPA